jgi:thioredoxin-like negative regulator of GroEL
MAPMVHGLEAEYSGRVKFSYLDADDPNTDTFQRTLGFAYQPEFYIVAADGTVLEKLIGFVPEEKFRSTLESHLD